MKILFFLIWLLPMTTCLAATQDIVGTWYHASNGWTYTGQLNTNDKDLTAVSGVSLSGGDFVQHADFSVGQTGRYVLDFKNTSIIGRFTHTLIDHNHHVIARFKGGIQSEAENPFFLRHAREVALPAGQYRLITELSSPFYLAQPEPYLDNLGHYRAAVRGGNALTLIGLGVFFGLGVYYAALSLARRRRAEGMYALFIVGNTLFNGCALLVFPQLFGLHWIYLASLPILLSNMAYIAFVMALLAIRRPTHPILHRIGVVMLWLLGGFFFAGIIQPNWSLELARYGVGVFLTYGLTVGIVRAAQGNVPARLYLVAIAVFFALGTVAISLSQLAGTYTLYIEHVGLLAVAVEVILLALVLAYQFGQVHREREAALIGLKQNQHLARTDALTGLANRFALDNDLLALSPQGSLTFLDLDNLKYYNDCFGHERGDDLLRNFAQQLALLLDDTASLYRVGGDEFAVICPNGDIARIEQAIVDTTTHLKKSGFDLAGASAGSAQVSESTSLPELKRIADRRMYNAKRKNKQAGLYQQA